MCTKFHSNQCKDIGVEKKDFDGTEGQTKHTLNTPLQFYDGDMTMGLLVYNGKIGLLEGRLATGHWIFLIYPRRGQSGQN